MYEIEPIATIKNGFSEKFGIPRQSSILENEVSTIIFEQKYRDENALRGLEGYSHIWLLWMFSQSPPSKAWHPTVRPPRLGGNKRMGVFATRSPYHPNRIGLSCVRLLSIEKDEKDGAVLKVAGADLLCGTPIIDIKPYLAFTDSHEDAKCGFAEEVFDKSVNVIFDEHISEKFEGDFLDKIKVILEQDPRPSYQADGRKYGMRYNGHEIKFMAESGTITVISIEQE